MNDAIWFLYWDLLRKYEIQYNKILKRWFYVNKVNNVYMPLPKIVSCLVHKYGIIK